MQRILVLIFGGVSYLFFFLTFLYFVAFVGNLQLTVLAEWIPELKSLVPQSLDAGRPTGATTVAILINLFLVLLFALQHSIMARSGFKQWLTRHLPPSAERSVFVFMASLLLVLLMWQWRPLPTTLWDAQSTWGQAVGWSVFGAGFTIVLFSTYLIDHFDLFGLRQAWDGFRRRESKAPRFMTPLLYRIVRHPLYFGFLLAFWGTPTMSHGRLLFAGAMTVYIVIAVRLEERDLVRVHGDRYMDYQARVPKLIPIPGVRYTDKPRA